MISIFAKTIPTRARRNQLQGFARQSFLHWAGFEVFTNVLVSKTIVRSISGIVNTLVLFVLSFMNSSSHDCHFYPTNGNFFIPNVVNNPYFSGKLCKIGFQLCWMNLFYVQYFMYKKETKGIGLKLYKCIYF